VEPPLVVWLVDADHWPRASLRAELIERGYDAVGFEHLEDALTRLVHPGVEPPRLLLIDVEGQHATVRQLELLARKHFFLVLTGGKVALAAPMWDAHGLGSGTIRPAIVLPRPISIGELANAVGSLLRPLR
jgi:hypothetical protein